MYRVWHFARTNEWLSLDYYWVEEGLEEEARKARLWVQLPEKDQDLFVAFKMEKSDYSFTVDLVNNSRWDYDRVIVLTGAFASDDDGLLETSKVVREAGPLRAFSKIQIDKSDWYELDFVIWFNLDLIPVSPEQEIKRLTFSLPKYGLGYREELLPIIDTRAMKISLQSRGPRDPVIKEQVKTMDMASKYHKPSPEREAPELRD